MPPARVVTECLSNWDRSTIQLIGVAGCHTPWRAARNVNRGRASRAARRGIAGLMRPAGRRLVTPVLDGAINDQRDCAVESLEHPLKSH